MNLTLRYGRAGLPIKIGDDLDAPVLHLNPLPPLQDKNAAREESFRALIGGAPLGKIARGGESTCLVISDVTRPLPNETLLTPVTDQPPAEKR